MAMDMSKSLDSNSRNNHDCLGAGARQPDRVRSRHLRPPGRDDESISLHSEIVRVRSLRPISGPAAPRLSVNFLGSNLHTAPSDSAGAAQSSEALAPSGCSAMSSQEQCEAPTAVSSSIPVIVVSPSGSIVSAEMSSSSLSPLRATE